MRTAKQSKLGCVRHILLSGRLTSARMNGVMFGWGTFLQGWSLISSCWYSWEAVKTWGAGGHSFEGYCDPGLPLLLLPRSGRVNDSSWEHVPSHDAQKHLAKWPGWDLWPSPSFEVTVQVLCHGDSWRNPYGNHSRCWQYIFILLCLGFWELRQGLRQAQCGVFY